MLLLSFCSSSAFEIKQRSSTKVCYFCYLTKFLELRTSKSTLAHKPAFSSLWLLFCSASPCTKREIGSSAFARKTLTFCSSYCRSAVSSKYVSYNDCFQPTNSHKNFAKIYPIGSFIFAICSLIFLVRSAVS